MDRRKMFGGAIGSLIGLAAGSEAAEARRRLCGRCGGRAKCKRGLKCIDGRCVPKSHPVIVCEGNTGAYNDCQNGRQPVCQGGQVVCPGGKTATPYCG